LDQKNLDVLLHIFVLNQLFVKKYLRIDRKEICFLRFIFEAYDGIGTITTVDPALGIVLLQISPGCEEEVAIILLDLQKDIMIEHEREFPQS